MIAVVNVAKEICARLLGIFLQAAVDARLYCVAESERRESLNFRVRARTQEDLATPNLFRDTDNLLKRCPVTILYTGKDWSRPTRMDFSGSAGIF